MKNVFLTLTLLASSSVSWAGPFVSEGPGPVATYATCNGQLEDGSAVSFEVRATAAINFIDSVLVDTKTNALIDQLSCVKGKNRVKSAPSAGKIEWLCTEYIDNNRMGISVELSSGGVVGATTGQIKQEQIYPLEPKVIGSLICE